MSSQPVRFSGEKTIFGHPRGLYVLFFAEMWERFSYYGMRALLMLYLVGHWMFSDTEASHIYGAYTALVYIAPVIGGYLADRWLGQRKAVLFGAVLLTAGHVLMAVEGDGGRDAAELNIFWMALAFIIVGSGFLKANISVIVGQLYPRTDIRRDSAYTIFYVGINLGAFLGALVAGFLGQTYGWAYGFGVAGLGMLLGLVVFVLGKPALRGKGESKVPEKLEQRLLGIKFEWLLYLLAFLSVLLVWFLVQYHALVGGLLGTAGVILVGYVLYTAVFKLAKHDRNRIFAALYLIFGSILFWALFEQAGSSLNLFTDRSVDRTVFGWDVPASMFQSLNSAYIIILGPFFAMLWTWLGRRGLEPSAPAKFGLGVIQVGLGFLVLVAGITSTATGDLTPMLFIFLIYLLHTTGELCLSPVGLSAMNRLAPAHLASLIMGTWFFAAATGNFVAGLISAATGGDNAVEGTERIVQVYSNVGWLAVGVGVVMVVVSPLIRRLMHLDTLRDEESDLVGEGLIGEPAAAGVHPEGGDSRR